MGFLDAIRRRGKPRTPQDTDALALRHLTRRGADLAQARHVLHFLYFADEVNARAAAAVADRASWRVTVTAPGERIVEWTVRVEGDRVLNPATVAAFRAWFERLAEDHHGEYDGWEAAAKP